MVSLRLLLSASFLLCVNAIPQTISPRANAPVSTLPDDQVHAFRPYTHYAGSVGFGPAKTLPWTCGSHCEANPTFKPVAAGGDGSLTQFWLVGYDLTLETVIVAHQGTDPSKILPLITDALLFMSPLDASLFPGISGTMQVHHGFGFAHAQSAAPVLAAVQTALAQSGLKKVTVVGHSLGAAIALISSVYLPLHLPADTVFRTVAYGLPRVGNKAFADYVDAHANVSHISNKYDLVPAYPDRALGFVHPGGEIHIVNSGAWVNCPGQENTNAQCMDGYTPNVVWGAIGEIFAGQDQHRGPFDGVPL